MGKGKCNGQKCPKGKYMAAECNATSIMCEICPRHTFIGQENNMRQCLPCMECNNNLVTVKECEADKNTECWCKPGYYCIHPSNSYCDHCSPVSKCPPGKGVNVKYTFQSDTVCKPCPEGTYSNVEDYESVCKNHTSCDDFGQDVKVPGTSTSDVECGNFKTCTTSCSWLLPASLWTGIVVTALIVFLVLFIIYWRNKRRSQRSEISLSHISPVLPPDILKYPADFDMEKCVECDKLNETDSCIQSDGVMSMKSVSEKCSQITAADGYSERMYHSTYHSQPQESEWND